MLFSAKEAFYKAQYCLTARWLKFGDGQFHLTKSGFAIELIVDLPGVRSRGSRLNGRYCEDEARVVTLATTNRSNAVNALSSFLPIDHRGRLDFEALRLYSLNKAALK